MSSYEYTVRVDAELETLEVTVCFEGSAGNALRCPQASATFAVRSAEVISPTRQPLMRDGRLLRLPEDLEEDACVRYSVSISDAIGSSFWGGARAERAVMLSASGWLWAPTPLAPDATGTLRFDASSGAGAALPYPRRGDHYELRPSAFGYLSHTVFGEFASHEVDVPGGRLRVAKMGGEHELSDSDLMTWLGRAATTAAELHGRFPVEDALIVLMPVGRGDEVVFGNVGRGGGNSVLFVVSEDATLDGLAADWVPPHEFTHLAMPFVRRRDAWMSEGVATYYQEVLRARAGVLTPLEAYRNMDAGFASGRRDGTGRPLGAESENMFASTSFRRVYWAGAALAFLADVGLRRRGSSLDAGIQALDECCAVPQRSWGGLEVAAALDRVTGHDVYVHTAERWLAVSDFPDVSELYAFLGLRRDDEGQLQLVDGAPGIAIRDAIMAPR